MSWRHHFLAAIGVGVALVAEANVAWASSPSGTNAAPLVPAPAPVPHARRIRALDADNHLIQLNRPGMISVIVGTNEDSQNAARAAGRAVYPFQGRPDFALIVVVDLRHTIASWVPSIVISRMKVSLDQEAYELKPYFLKNGNHNNPRGYSHVIPDFTGTICPQLNWKEGEPDLRVILYGVDGRELERLDKVDVDDMGRLQDDVRKAIQTQVAIEQAKIAAAGKPAPSRSHPPLQHPPLVPYTPLPIKKDD
jgi:hypothetical protein